MRTETIDVYKFKELSDDAKQRAIEDWRNRDGYEIFWADEGYETLRAFCDAFGLDYRSSCYSQQPETDIRFGGIDDTIKQLKGRRLIAYIHNNYSDILFQRKHYGKYEKRANGKWRYDRYSRCQWEDSSCPFTGFGCDDAMLQPIRNYLKKPDMHMDWEDLIRDCIGEWESYARSDAEDQASDEYISEHLIANEYEFTANGKWY